MNDTPMKTPTIFKLHEDILSHIFALNACSYVDMGQNLHRFVMLREERFVGPITPTRHASQVCRGWRTLILSSPTIWATTLDLQFLAQKTDNWRNEVLKRTGQTLLTVIAYINDGEFPFAFFLDLLAVHWNRIKTLFICIHPHAGNKRIVVRDGINKALRYPAPNLNFCTVLNVDTPYSPSSTVLFSGETPRLYSLTLEGLKVKICGPWLSNICRFTLLWNVSFSVKDVFQALADMPLLEELTLEAGPLLKEDQNLGLKFSIVNLPHLKSIALYNSVAWLTYIVDTVVPKPGCSLIHSVGDVGEVDVEADTVGSLRESYATFFRQHSNSSDITYLSYKLGLPLGATSFRIKGKTDDTPGSCEAERQRILIEYKHVPFDEWLNGSFTDFISKALLTCDLRAVSTLKFLVQEMEDVWDILAFQDFFKVLTSATFPVGVTILPLLTIIKYTASGPMDGKPLKKFITHRRAHGVPVEYVHIETHGPVHKEMVSTLLALEDITVVWKKVGLLTSETEEDISD